MIVIVSRDKQTKTKIKIPTIDIYREWFLTHQDQWVHGWKLEAKLGVGSIRAYVNKLRNEGLPIISSTKGYKYTKNKEEIKLCYEELKLRALRALTAAKEMKKLL